MLYISGNSLQFYFNLSQRVEKTYSFYKYFFNTLGKPVNSQLPYFNYHKAIVFLFYSRR